MRLSLLFLAALFIVLTVQAQTPPVVKWIKKNGPVGGEILEIEVDPATGKIFMIDGDRKPYVSSDSATSWQTLTISGSGNYFTDIEITNGTIFLVGSYELYASTDGGVIFENRMTSVSPYSNPYRLKRMPASGNLVVLSYNSLYFSSNNGQTWTQSGVLSDVDTRYLEINSLDQIFILKQNATTFDTRPFRSTDGGASFTESSSGITENAVQGLFGENAGGKVYCITSAGMYSSTNGLSWANVKTGITDAIITDYGQNNTSLIEFSADGLGMFFVDNVNHKLYSKTLAGGTWELQSGAFPSGTLSALCASAKDYPSATTSTAFFGTPSGVFRTTTGGASVTENNTGIANVKGEQIVADNYGNLFLRTSSLGLLKSQDGGNNWAKVTNLATSPTNPIKFFFQTTQGDALFAISNYNTLYRSFDQGGSWPAITPSGGFIWAGATDGGKVFGLQNTSVSSTSPITLYYSSNNGSTWTTSPVSITGFPASFSITETSIRFASANQMLLNLYDYGTSTYKYYKIDFTYNITTFAISSAVASEITTVPIAATDISKFTAANGKFYAYNNGSPSGVVAISADGGVNWTSRTLPASWDFFVAKNGYMFFTDRNSRKVHISRDDAVTFQETSLSSTTNVDNIRDITIDNSGLAYLAFYGDYVYQSEFTIVPPTSPTGLEGIGLGSTSLALRWVDVNTSDRDIVIERSVNGIDFLKAGQVNGSNVCNSSGNRGFYVDKNILPNTTYTYRIKATNKAGESLPTSTVILTTLNICAQTIPDNRSWDAVNSGVESYTLISPAKKVGVKHLGGGKYEISDLSLGLTGSSVKSTFYESCGQTFVEGTYDLKPNGNSTWNGTTTLTLKWRQCSADKTETITLTLNADDPTPVAPTKLLAYVITNTSAEIKWTANYYEKTYILERSLSLTSGFSSIATVSYPTTSFIDNGPFANGTTYYYRARSINGNPTPIESPNSTVTSLPFAKPNFLVSNNAITSFKSAATLGSFWADFNNDGNEDYFSIKYDPVTESAKPIIFKNLGTADFEQFNPIVDNQLYFWPSVVDFDNDNFPDLIFIGQETTLFDLYKGNGDFTFTKIPAAQLGDLAALDKIISNASWADINNDGLLDVMLTNSDIGGLRLYKQNANGSFNKILGGDLASDLDRASLSLWADYNNDGLQDVFILNNSGASRLYRNNGNETFTKIIGSGINVSNLNTAAWGDYNNDGNVDLFCASTSINTLYKNNGNETFTEDATTSISEPIFNIAAAWGDYNNDGYLDLLTTGFISTQTRLFIRDASAPASIVFKKIISEKINDLSVSHYGVAHADYDKNGFLDLAISAFIFEESGDGISATNNNFYQNNNITGNWSEVKLSPVNGNKESIGVKIILTADGKTQSRELASLSSLISRNSNVAHFGLGSASAITNIQVKWTNGSVQNYPNPPINQILIINEDVQGPVITSKTPANNATGIATNTTIEIVFDENTIPVNGKKLNFTRTGDTVPFTSVDATSGTKTGNQYQFSLPLSLAAETEYSVTIDAGAFTDKYGNTFLGITTGTWKLTTMPVPDVTGPVITFTPSSSIAKGTNLGLQSTVTDEKTVSSVNVFARKISTTNYINENGTAAAGNIWSVSLTPTTHFDAIGTEYYIEATDNSGNKTRKPEGADTYKTYLIYSAADAKIPSERLGFGGQVSNWKIFAIPFDLGSNNSVETVFDEFNSLENKVDYRLITYQNASIWSEFPSGFSTIQRGKGYFINIKNSLPDIGVGDNLTAPNNSRSNLFPMNLVQGWNLIGNPYLTQISWADVAIYNGLTGTAGEIKKYTGSAYSVQAQTLAPYEGGFVFVPAAIPNVSIPFSGQTTAGGRIKGFASLSTDINEDAWALKLNLYQRELTYELGSVGMAPDASLSFDDYDDITPPRFFDFLEMNFNHPEFFANQFTRDIVPTQNTYKWEFTVDTNTMGEVKLAWDNALLIGGPKELFLLDVARQTLVNMKEVGSFAFDPKESFRFKIYYGENLKIAPERVALGKAYPNPTSGYTVVGFSLPESGGLNQKVTLDIVDLTGRPIGIVSQGGYNPGYHEVSFYAKDMNTGFYTYRLTVQNLKGRTTEVNKLIIK